MYTENARRGAELLDREHPGWFRMIDLGHLKMQSCDDCILGQIYGHYDSGKYHLPIIDLEAYGFTIIGNRLIQGTWSKLAKAWRTEIQHRLAQEGGEPDA